MRHFCSSGDANKFSNFKKEIGSILRKINRFDKPHKFEAISYLQRCIRTAPDEICRKRSSRCIRSEIYVKPVLYKCRSCNVTTNTKFKLFQHFETHIGTPISCRKCKRAFNSHMAYDWHQKHLCHLKQTSIKKYKCNECSQEFRFKRHYECHLDGHKRNNCVCCNMVITHRKQLIQHMLKVHSIKLETAIHKCRHCEKRYVKKKSLYYHMRQHCTNKLVCIDCGTVCSSPEEYSMHLLQHETHKPYKCGKCTERFYRRQQYVSHLKRHNRYKCLTCNEGYASKAKAIRHKQKGHDVEGLDPRMACPYCPAAFHRKLALHKHMRKHTDVKPTINCKFCDKTFQSPYRYYKHCMTVMHEKQNPETNQLVCENCGKQFRKKYLLEQHLKRVHKTPKETQGCQFCEYKTHNRANLERHVALHLNQTTKYICEQCGKSYLSMASLKDHIAYMHKNEKEFSCNECGKNFKRNSDLTRHMATHSDIRPHTCDMCGKAYKRTTHLTRHKESAHNLVAKNNRKVERIHVDTPRKDFSITTLTKSSEDVDLTLLNVSI